MGRTFETKLHASIRASQCNTRLKKSRIWRTVRYNKQMKVENEIIVQR